MAFANTIKDELNSKGCQQDPGNASYHIRAGYAEHAPERIDQHQCRPGQRQGKQQCEEEDDNLDGIAARLTHQEHCCRYAGGPRNQWDRERENRNLAGTLGLFSSLAVSADRPLG
jgi:hypothetical protein